MKDRPVWIDDGGGIAWYAGTLPAAAVGAKDLIEPTINNGMSNKIVHIIVKRGILDGRNTIQ